jgi:polyferredoxin
MRGNKMEQELKEEIEQIKQRNKRVEKDKAWETSWTRRICIMILTYIVVVLYSFSIAKISNIWLSSLVPVIGFTLSTLSLNVVRKIWEKKQK